MSLNRVVLVGRLVADPEMKYTPQGVPVTQMRIAVNRVTKNEQGEYESDFFNVTAWRRTAEFAANYLKKGRLISVDGRLKTRSWVDQATQQKRNAVEIEADNIEGLDRRGETEEAASGEAGAAPVYQPAAPRPAAGARTAPPAVDDMDESDPFADE